jgi:pimeloyl-ACP methyl ester carboxylesterase
MRAKHVFFIRGLSTYGNDNAKWSVFDFGPMYKHLATALEARGLIFHPVLGLGAGSLDEITERAINFLRNDPVWNDSTQTVHLLGHSAGGLVVRKLLPRLQRNVERALTIASPHRGSELAQICLGIPAHYRGSNLLLKSFGYNVASKSQFFRELTPESIARSLPPLSEQSAHVGRIGSVVCSAPRSEWCLPLKIFYKVKAFDDFRTPSDGLVERDSQAFGEVIGEVPIDHFRQIGLFDGGGRFSRLCDVTAGFFNS